MTLKTSKAKASVMLKNNNHFIISLVILVMDQVTKLFFQTLVWNQGFFLSSFEGLSGPVRVGIAAPFFVSFLLFMIWCGSEVKQRFSSLALAITVFVSGVTGNFIDQIWFGAVRDFILIESLGIAYNVADAFQWLGMVAGIVLLWKHHSALWPDLNARNFGATKLFKESKSLLGVILVIVIALGGITIFSTAYLEAAIQTQQWNRTHFILLSVSLLITLTLLIAVFLIRYTQRILGPIKALERWLDENEKDASAPQPRLNDDFGPYRGLVEKMKNKLLKND